MTRRPLTVTQDETIAELLAGSRRDELPIRKTFVQQGRGRVRDPGPLAHLCTHHDERALDLYLLIHARASQKPFDVALPATVWARMLGLSASASARSSVSKALRRLEDLNLIIREREGRKAKITLLADDGTGHPYAHPSTERQRYLKLPYAFWQDGWHRTLRMPGKTLLLIGLSLDDGFILPTEKGPDWYGVSADTVQRGLTELRQAGLLTVEEIPKKAPLAPAGFTLEPHYTLQPPFGPRRQPLATVTKLRA